jgi:hypothetical protein
LGNGSSIEGKGSDGQAALIAAAKNGHEDLVTTLLSVGADHAARDLGGETALSLAAGKSISQSHRPAITAIHNNTIIIENDYVICNWNWQCWDSKKWHKTGDFGVNSPEWVASTTVDSELRRRPLEERVRRSIMFAVVESKALKISWSVIIGFLA